MTPSLNTTRRDNMKKWYTSKTLWVNFISLLAMVIHGITGVEWLSIEVQATLLSVINILLRVVTKEEISWKTEQK
jgi:hypothetical protein